MPSTQIEPLDVSYGPRLEVFVRALRADDLDYPSAVRLPNGLAHSGEVRIEQTALDAEDGLLYVVATGTEDEAPAYVAAWGAPDSVWVVAVSAPSQQLRAALAEAFVEAVRASAIDAVGGGWSAEASDRDEAIEKAARRCPSRPPSATRPRGLRPSN